VKVNTKTYNLKSFNLKNLSEKHLTAKLDSIEYLGYLRWQFSKVTAVPILKSEQNIHRNPS